MTLKLAYKVKRSLYIYFSWDTMMILCLHGVIPHWIREKVIETIYAWTSFNLVDAC